VVTVAGAGMAGLVAAARLAELGTEPVVLERGDRPGGSMLLASGVVWRYRTFEAFRDECPGGDPALQRVIHERLDDALSWLRAAGAPVAAESTGNPRTVGMRFDPAGIVAALTRRVRPLLGHDLVGDERPLVLATGGYAARLARERGLPLRAAAWSDGAGIESALAQGAALAGEPSEFYGRLQPAPPAVVAPPDFVRAAQLYGALAHPVDTEGRPFFAGEPRWDETDLALAVARLPGARAWLVVDGDALGRPAGGRTVAERVAVAEELGGEVRRAAEPAGLGLGPLASAKLRTPPFAAVLVQPGVTHTYAGLAVDAAARVLDGAGRPLDALYAAGADVGGVFTGGYTSGLAAALVLGLVAAESAAAGL
jgi:succinate dehydrogenase/fumarate reductase flavoprotein subunit